MAKFSYGNILDKLDDIEEPSIVKIYTKIIGRKYKRRYHAYPKHLVPVSACYNELIVDFLKEKSLEERIYILEETMLLTLTRRKSEATQNGNK
jgi:hypothetical protein